ncbi:hypothetical protein ASG49_08725 [Marmoricola sp. Leaf446]|uniref:sensor histidine kinase n=1 Tax=Marmoricola sp. Leaf446 TaxID=1736379 RepID=UPI00070061CE|nr:PAS domain-containing sensor histidine kinase [Marmoricola sp. Leaf446]KQT92051.1 hypothetical protein ASG49_08725 [Marmoricola sp. Leaf446]
MQQGQSSDDPVVLRAHRRTPTPPAPVRVTLLLLAVVVAAWLGSLSIAPDGLVPAVWPAGGLAAGMLLVSPRRWRLPLVGVVGVVGVLAHVGVGLPLPAAAGAGAAYALASWTTRCLLVRGHTGRVALLEPGDVSRMIGAVAGGSLVAGGGLALTAVLTGHGRPWLTLLSGFGSTAAATLVLLPLFLRTLPYAALSGTRERLAQAVITVGTTSAVFLATDVPPVVFVVMPMFAWHAYRGSLRGATVLLTVVAAIGTAVTELGHGPIWSLGPRYDLAPELVDGVLQLFVIDCALILLPLSAMVTQQRAAAARARAERQTLERVVYSAAGTAIVATDRAGLITVFNPQAEEVFGRPGAEAIGRPADLLWSTTELRQQARDLGTDADVPSLCRAAVASGELDRLWHLGAGEEARVLRMIVSPLPDADGAETGYLMTAEDVTEREAAQRVLVQTLEHQRVAVARLQELERVKGDFVSTVSHELRTPITSIIGYTEVLEDGMVGELSEAQLDIVDRVDRNGRRLLLLVEDLLTLSQIETSRLEIQPEPIDLREVLRGAHDAISATVGQRLLDVTLTLPAAPARHDGDPRQLERMVTNLLTNAVKFTPDGGEVRIGLRAEGGQSVITVADTGIGIPEAEQEQLFTRFFRSSTATEQAIPGTGLGLTIARAIVALHGGTVSIASRDGHGTTVRVQLPPGVPTVVAERAPDVAAGDVPTLVVAPEPGGVGTSVA